MICEAHNSALNAPVAIFGWGVSGQGAAALLERRGVEFEVFDEGDLNIARNEFTAKDAEHFSTVVCSPGFPMHHPWLKRAREAGCECMGEIDLASLFWDGPMIAVTGTNGKTTLCTLLAEALGAIGKPAIAAGNIGYSLSRELEHGLDDKQSVVCEVSSFQSEVIQRFRSDALLWTNFAEDHLDRHGDMETYFNAKWNLVDALMDNVMIVGESVAGAAMRFGKKLPDFAQVVTRAQASSIPAGSPFVSYPQQENYLIALKYWELCGYERETLESVAKNFQLPNHRLQRVGNIQGVTFWNDSKATNFSATYAALNTFDEPVVWLGGGRSKGGDLQSFAEQLSGKLSHACLIGDVREELGVLLTKAGVPVTLHDSMESAVEMAYHKAKQSVLLSPGFASFGQFDSYAHRGKSFEKAVFDLKKHLQKCDNLNQSKKRVPSTPAQTQNSPKMS